MIQLIPAVESTASALEAERIRMEVIGQNIANANTTRGVDGKPFRRQQVVFESLLRQELGRPGAAGPAKVTVSKIVPDPRPFRLVYNPGHPDADAQGMVALPNISIHEEMADMIAASRAFEANLAVVKTARTMAAQTLSIGKRS
ncbi:flagellar basal body rod protein FlgC [Fontisphaera persica]|uniref:flagellar basal body rod protein FlgC n=1 Tax=Fontisphaera persica TaxID=2974023 RepID=UPI0024BF989C|nr:flagellar basal body rod protein FlgC [Fontisphaera persica]WCJ58232.1 flagellar basal body rod protein FlgC [Fontisphaera persica]